MQASEDFLIHLFEDANLCAIHAKRVTLSKLEFNPHFKYLGSVDLLLSLSLRGSAEGLAASKEDRRRPEFLRRPHRLTGGAAPFTSSCPLWWNQCQQYAIFYP